MTINPDRLTELRPWAIHTTTPVNFAAIRIWRRLRSAADLLTGTHHEHVLQSRRLSTVRVTVAGVPVEIRDQVPLQRGHIRFEQDFTFEVLLAELNNRVFFWLGSETGLRERGQAHFNRCKANGPLVVLRCSLRELLSINGGERAYVAASNSGAPRSHPTAGYALRGRSTFRLFSDAPFTAGQVQELSFRQQAKLPSATEWSTNLAGPWQRI